MLPNKILFCTDFSENSEPARELALSYAKAFGAELLIIHVVDLSTLVSYADALSPSIGGKLSGFLQEAKESAEARLESLARESGQGVKEVIAFCKIGSVSKEITALATKESADLIVVGTHGHMGVKDLLMGSTARSVLRMAHRPVLIVEGPTGKERSSE